MTKPSGRNQSIDALKGAAILAVVFLHLPSSPLTRTYAWQLLDILGRFAVPCFFLISGYFFHLSWQRSEHKRSVLEKSAWRIIPIFLFWALFYAITPPLIGGGGALQHLLGIVRYPHSFILSGNVYHLWFLSSLLQGLSILWISLQIRRPTAGLLLGAALFTLALISGTYASTPVGHPIAFEMKNGPFLSTIFVMLGALMAGNHLKLSIHQAIGLAIFGYFFCVAEVSFLHFYFNTPFSGQSLMIGTIPLAIGLMNLALHGRFPASSLAFLGKYSLGIYVIHPWVIELLKNLGIQNLNVAPLLYLILTTTISLLFTLALSKIPYTKNLVA